MPACSSAANLTLSLLWLWSNKKLLVMALLLCGKREGVKVRASLASGASWQALIFERYTTQKITTTRELLGRGCQDHPA